MFLLVTTLHHNWHQKCYTIILISTYFLGSIFLNMSCIESTDLLKIHSVFQV